MLADDTSLISLHADSTKRQRARSLYVVRFSDAADIALSTRILPLQESAVTSPMYNRPTPRTADLQRLVAEMLPHWTACFTPKAVVLLSRLAGQIYSDERAAARGAETHRQWYPHDKATATLILGI